MKFHSHPSTTFIELFCAQTNKQTNTHILINVQHHRIILRLWRGKKQYYITTAKKRNIKFNVIKN